MTLSGDFTSVGFFFAFLGVGERHTGAAPAPASTSFAKGESQYE